MKQTKQVITEPLDDRAKAEVFSAEKGAPPPEGYLRDYVALFLRRNRIVGKYEMPHMARARLIAAGILAAVLLADIVLFFVFSTRIYIHLAAAAAALAVYAVFVRYVCSMRRYLIKEILRRPDEDIDVFLFDTLSVAQKRMFYGLRRALKRPFDAKQGRAKSPVATRPGEKASYPDTYGEIVTFSLCRAFGKYFSLTEDGVRYFFEGLADGEILSVQGLPGGIVRVRNRRETVTTVLQATEAMDPAEIRSVLLTKDRLEINPDDE